jgi:hypothetical protein
VGSSNEARLQTRGEGKRSIIRTFRALHDKVDRCRERCEALEVQLGIDRWTRDDPEFIEANKYNEERSFRLKLDRVERLVVQRLMEMQKCHIRGTSKYLKIYNKYYDPMIQNIQFQIIKCVHTLPSTFKREAKQSRVLY